MSETARAMTLGEIISRSFRVYIKNWKLFIALALVPVLVQVVVYTSAELWWNFHPLPYQGIAASLTFKHKLVDHAETVICSLFNYAFFPCYMIAISLMLAGEKPLLKKVLQNGFKRIGALSSVTLLNVIICSALPTIPLLIFVRWVTLFTGYEYAPGTAHSAGTTMIWIAISLETLTAAWLSISLDMGIFALVLERKNPIAALKRSWELASEARVRLAVIYLLIFILMIGCVVLYVIFFTMLQVVLKRIFPAALMPIIEIISRQITFFPVFLVLTPLWPIVLSLVYYDQRIRQEYVSFPELLKESLNNMLPERAAAAAEGGFVPIEEGAHPNG